MFVLLSLIISAHDTMYVIKLGEKLNYENRNFMKFFTKLIRSINMCKLKTRSLLVLISWKVHITNKPMRDRESGAPNLVNLAII